MSEMPVVHAVSTPLWCPTRSKMRFSTEQSATEAALTATKQWGEQYEAYQCPCARWHIRSVWKNRSHQDRAARKRERLAAERGSSDPRRRSGTVAGDYGGRRTHERLPREGRQHTAGVARPVRGAGNQGETRTYVRRQEPRMGSVGCGRDGPRNDTERGDMMTAPAQTGIGKIRWLLMESTAAAGLDVSVWTVNQVAEEMQRIMRRDHLLLIFESTFTERLREEDAK